MKGLYAIKANNLTLRFDFISREFLSTILTWFFTEVWTTESSSDIQDTTLADFNSAVVAALFKKDVYFSTLQRMLANSLSLSLYIYIYIYIYVCVCVCISLSTKNIVGNLSVSLFHSLKDCWQSLSLSLSISLSLSLSLSLS